MIYADRYKDWINWDYLEGNLDVSIASQRYYHLLKLNVMDDHDLKIAARDKDTRGWTRWKRFNDEIFFKGGFTMDQLRYAYDLHRTLLKNEIVVESDYPTYEENYEATRLLGAIIESKGFIPHYYYSGNRSIHSHVYISWDHLLTIDMFLQKEIIGTFKYPSMFKKKFIEWIRNKMITCWDTNIREFDKQLIKSNHLIRSEMSRNKLGYKTFLGYTYKDVSFVPYICNEINRIYPKIGKIKLSKPHCIQHLVEEFLTDWSIKQRKRKARRKEKGLENWEDQSKELRPEVKFILSDEFKELGDGFKRGMFILANELKRVYGNGEALAILKDWNARMDYPIDDYDIKYRMKTKVYHLPNKYIKDFLSSIGYGNVKKV